MRTTKNGRNFGILAALIFVWFAYLAAAPAYALLRSFSIFLAIICVFIALTQGQRFDWIAGRWIAFGELLGRFISPILLGFIYYVLITPIALWFRVCRRDQLCLRSNGLDTVWRPKENNDKETSINFDLQYQSEKWILLKSCGGFLPAAKSAGWPPLSQSQSQSVA